MYVTLKNEKVSNVGNNYDYEDLKDCRDNLEKLNPIVNFLNNKENIYIFNRDVENFINHFNYVTADFNDEIINDEVIDFVKENYKEEDYLILNNIDKKINLKEFKKEYLNDSSFKGEIIIYDNLGYLPRNIFSDSFYTTFKECMEKKRKIQLVEKRKKQIYKFVEKVEEFIKKDIGKTIDEVLNEYYEKGELSKMNFPFYKKVPNYYLQSVYLNYLQYNTDFIKNPNLRKTIDDYYHSVENVIMGVSTIKPKVTPNKLYSISSNGLIQINNIRKVMRFSVIEYISKCYDVVDVSNIEKFKKFVYDNSQKSRLNNREKNKIYK
ncbi:MAG: hypothetical protein ACOCP8_06700 [archaeon]